MKHVVGGALAAISILSGLGCADGASPPEVRAKFRGELDARVKSYRARTEQVLPRLAEDRRAAEAHPVFANETRLRDAGPFLNPRVSWIAGARETSKRAVAAHRDSVAPDVRPLALSKEIRARLSDESRPWTEAGADVPLDSLDFSWMAELAAFDHWRIEENSPWQHYQPFAFEDAPIPNFIELIDWAKLRLLVGLRDQRLDEAVEEVRALARLCATAETIFGPHIGLRLWWLDSQLPGGDVEVAKAAVEPVRRYLRSNMRLYSLLAHPAVLREHLDPNAPAFCAQALEILWAIYLIDPLWADYLEEAHLPEDLRDSFTQLRRLPTRTDLPCRWPVLREAWAERASKGRFIDHFRTIPSKPGPRRAHLVSHVEAGLVKQEWLENPEDIVARMVLLMTPEGAELYDDYQ